MICIHCYIIVAINVILKFFVENIIDNYFSICAYYTSVLFNNLDAKYTSLPICIRQISAFLDASQYISTGIFTSNGTNTL